MLLLPPPLLGTAPVHLSGCWAPPTAPAPDCLSGPPLTAVQVQLLARLLGTGPASPAMPPQEQAQGQHGGVSGVARTGVVQAQAQAQTQSPLLSQGQGQWAGPGMQGAPHTSTHVHASTLGQGKAGGAGAVAVACPVQVLQGPYPRRAAPSPSYEVTGLWQTSVHGDGAASYLPPRHPNTPPQAQATVSGSSAPPQQQQRQQQQQESLKSSQHPVRRSEPLPERTFGSTSSNAVPQQPPPAEPSLSQSHSLFSVASLLIADSSYEVTDVFQPQLWRSHGWVLQGGGGAGDGRGSSGGAGVGGSLRPSGGRGQLQLIASCHQPVIFEGNEEVVSP